MIARPQPPHVQHQGSNAERSRHRNRQAVLGQVRVAGSIGRAEIARALSLTTQTVSNIIAELSQDGMLLEKGRASGGRGLPAMQYALNPRGGYALGIEVRPDAIFAALLDLEGTAVVTHRVPLGSTAPEVVKAHVADLCARMQDKEPRTRGRMLGAGVVMPGPFGRTGISGQGSDLTGWQEVDAHTLFAETLDLPVVLSNDANAAAMAERVKGVAQDFPSFAYLYFGAGLGLGLVHRGQLVTGAHGNAGEIGHIPLPGSNGQPGGKLEDALSRLSVQRHLNAVGKDCPDIEMLEHLFAVGDADLQRWLERARAALAHAMAVVENLFDPGCVVLGGAMPDSILDHLVTQTALPPQTVVNRPDATHPRLIRGASGRMTATLGAASLVLNSVLSAPISHAH